MKPVQTLCLLTLGLLLSLGRSGAAQDTYTIDNAHTSLIFAVSHYNLSYTYGRFKQISGEFTWNENIPAASQFSFEIDAASIDTNDDGRDQHLRGPDFFNTDEHAKITFKTTKFEKIDDDYRLTGEMTMLGTTKEVEMPVRVVGIGKGPFGKERAGFFTKFTVRRSDYGMDKMLNSVGDNIAVTFSFEGIKQ